jgi:hypothetical protein
MYIWLVFIQYYHWWCTEPWTWNLRIKSHTSLCTIWVFMGSKGFHYFGTGSRWVISLTPQPFYLRGKSTRYKTLRVLYSRSGRFEEEKITWPSLKSNDTLTVLFTAQSLHPKRYPGFLEYKYSILLFVYRKYLKLCYSDTSCCVFLYHKQPKLTAQRNTIMSHVTVLYVSVRTNHHRALLITTI